MTLLFLATMAGFAADHIDADVAAADPAADITDLFAWHTDDSLVVALNVAPFGLPGDAAMYDADVLYGIHIDGEDSDNEPDHSIWVRFGQDSQGNWGLQVENFPGAGAPQVGPVGHVIPAPGGKIFAGLREDPFRFDFTGFTNTLATGDLSFSSPPGDDFEGTNVTSIVLEMDRNAAADGNDTIHVWATSARLSS